MAVDWNIRHYPEIEFQVWVPDYLLDFTKHLLTKGSVIRSFSKAKEKFDHGVLGMTTQWCTNHTCIRTHPVDYGFHMLSDRHVYDMNQKNYLKIRPDEISCFKDIPKDYVVISATSVEPVRTMPIKTANDIIDFCLFKNVTPVFLGSESSKCGFKDFAIKAKPLEINLHKGLNLINMTSLLESAKIISGAKAYVGMDGGLTHVAGCTDAFIICGYTVSDPIHIAPIRNGSQTYKFKAIEPDLFIKNRYFQTWSSFKKGNFQRFEGWEQVRDSMTPDKFIRALGDVL